MEERFIEIKFCFFIDKLFHKFKYNVATLDIIEAYCNLGNIDTNIIKTLVRQIKENCGTIITYQEEAVYIARQLGISYRDLEKMSGISVSTQQRLKDYYAKCGKMYEGLRPHLNKKEYDEVYKFVKIIEIMKEI